MSAPPREVVVSSLHPWFLYVTCMLMMLSMREVDLNQVDLNLLPALAALLEERHVSRAAARINLSQPATSRALQRLRRILDDQLLVRSSKGFQLTPRAEQLSRQLSDIVPGLERLFREDTFTPADDDRTWRIAGTDYAVSTFAAPLLRTLRAESPHSRLCWHSWYDHVFDHVDRGDLDLAFFGIDAPAHLRSQRLFTDTFVCLVDNNHPLAGRSAMDLTDYLACSHVIVDVDGGSQPAVDVPLAALGERRRAIVTVPYHVAALWILGGAGDLVATIPARLLDTLPDTAPYRVLSAPAELPAMSYCMSWHPRLDDDPAHRWLRAAVEAVSQSAAVGECAGPL